MLTPVTPGELAAVVTSLEMRTPHRPAVPPSPLRLARWERAAADDYRALFRRVGARWLWFSRLILDDGALGAILRDPAVLLHAVIDPDGREVGMLELDFRTGDACEIAFFGLVPELAGHGHGRWLMAQALALAWAAPIARLWVHTCTLDHPAALGFYRAQGFTPFAHAIETFADPRLLGILPRDCAPQIPLLDPAS